jgi:hypothetical protein
MLGDLSVEVGKPELLLPLRTIGISLQFLLACQLSELFNKAVTKDCASYSPQLSSRKKTESFPTSRVLNFWPVIPMAFWLARNRFLYIRSSAVGVLLFPLVSSHSISGLS